MKLRSAAVAGLTLVGLLSGVSGAAGKSCNLLQDPKGDAVELGPAGTSGGVNSPALDILSADVATDAKNLTAVLRVDKFSKTDSTSPLGNTWYVNFTAGATTFFVTALTTPTGDRFNAGYIGTTRTTLGAVEGVFDSDHSEIRITAPLSMFAAQEAIKPGTKISDLNALGQRFVGPYVPPPVGTSAGATITADSATGGSTYVAGNASCVAVGK